MGEGVEEDSKVIFRSGVSQFEVECLKDEDLKLKTIIDGHINTGTAHQCIHGELLGDLSFFMELDRKLGTLMARERQAMNIGIYLFDDIPGDRLSTRSK